MQRLFRQQVGCSPSEHLKQVRMDRARYLLTSTRLAIKEVVLEIGLQDVSHFAKDFKRLHGQTPSGYRRAAWSTVLPASVSEPSTGECRDAAFGQRND